VVELLQGLWEQDLFPLDAAGYRVGSLLLNPCLPIAWLCNEEEQGQLHGAGVLSVQLLIVLLVI
jgi:hypothetical protein